MARLGNAATQGHRKEIGKTEYQTDKKTEEKGGESRKRT